MARRSGLGRGLGALIPGDGDPTGTVLREVPVGSVRPNPNQPRAHFDEASLVSLAASIAEMGILQPLLVRDLGGGSFELIAGERRWRAAKRAGLTTVPVLVREADEMGSLEAAIVENLHRQDLSPLEEAAAYQQLIEDFALTHDQVAARVGKSRAAVTNALRLFQLPAPIQRLVGDGRLSGGHARALLGASDPAYQASLATRAVSEGMSVRAVEEAVRTRDDLAARSPSATRSGGRSTTQARQAGMHELEELLSEHLATRVKVEEGGRRGRVVIEFADLDDLERLYLAMTGGAAQGAGEPST